MIMTDAPPRLYGDLAGWFHLLTAPEGYQEEAELYTEIIRQSTSPAQSILELGSGGGNMASHYKRSFVSTLVDLSPAMLALSRSINPECEHLEGDMRTVRLGREFDAVFVHDAVVYMTTEYDLREAISTAFAHCRPGGVAIFAPDFLSENFIPGTSHGGHDRDGRGLRYLAWTWDPDPSDTTYRVDYAYLLREEDGTTRAVYDCHIEGLFGRDDWLRMLAEAGFDAEARTPDISGAPPDYTIFVARRP
jgi:SAM-dependent methyltransferase